MELPRDKDGSRILHSPPLIGVIFIRNSLGAISSRSLEAFF